MLNQLYTDKVKQLSVLVFEFKWLKVNSFVFQKIYVHLLHLYKS